VKVTNKQKKDNKVALDVEIPKEMVQKKYDEVYAQMGKEAKVPGFRPGKAPRNVLEQHHGAVAREEVIKGLVSESYDKSIKEEKIDVIDLPQISEVRFENDILTYKAEVEVKPEIKIKQYKGLKLKKDEVKASAKDVEAALEDLKKERAGVDDERLAKSLGYRSAGELKDCLEKQIFLKKENEARAKLEKEIIEKVLKNTSFKVPETLVVRRAHELEHQAMDQMAKYGMNEEQIKKRIEEYKPKFAAEAQEQVRVFLVLETIGRLEGELLFAEAEWQ